MEKKIKILLIEDIPEDIRYAEIVFEKMFGNNHILEVADYFSKAIILLTEKSFDIIILDLSLPDSKGLINFKKLVKSFSTPVIIYTGLTDEFIKSEAMTFGAMDYLVKGKTNDDTLKESIVNSIIQYSLDKQK